MANNISQLEIVIAATNKTSDELSKVHQQLGNLSTQTQATQKSGMGLLGGLGMLTAGYFAVKGVVFDSIKAWNEQQAAMAQTEAVLKSTNFAIGMSAKELGDLSGQLQATTAFGDEQVLSAENLLLTFTKIGKDVFPQATQTVLDMSVALGQDLKSSSIQLGKALQDPILGVTALRRVGVNFSADQQKVIKTLVETGHQLDAQKMILKELGTEFGGSAAKQLETFGGRMTWLKNQLGEVRESIGQGITESLVTLAEGFAGGSDHVQEFVNETKRQMAVWIPNIVFGFKTFGEIVWNVFQTVGQLIGDSIALWMAGFDDMVYSIQNFGKNISVVFGAMKKAMTGDFSGAWDDIQGVMSANTSNYRAALGVMVADTATNFGNFGGIITKNSEAAGKTTSRMMQDISDSGKGAGQALDGVAGASDAMVKKLKDAEKKIKDIRDSMKKATDGVRDDIKKLKNDFNETETQKSSDLGSNIAKEFVDQQTAKADLEKQLNAETDENNRATLLSKIAAIDEFFGKHQADQATYAAAIVLEQQKAKMDAIELLKLQFAEEKEQRKKDYDEKLNEYSDHLKQIKKEAKDKMKELKKEIQNGGLDAITVKLNFEVGDTKKSSNKKRAVGGPVMPDETYIVGENGPELFTPSSSGSINNNLGGSGKAVVNNYNFSFGDAFVGSKDDLTREIIGQINRRQELNQIGAY